jgi:sulfoxide reductase heme-binding subunit YedZ
MLSFADRPAQLTAAAGHLLAAGGTGPSPLWYATRATGVVALLLLTITVVIGVAGTARFATPQWPRVITQGLHRNISLLAVAFVMAHVLTTVLDSYAPIGLASAVIPFISPYRPLWLSLGAVAFDLLLALIVTSLLRAWLPYQAWRAVHWMAYASWPIALWHGLGTGTDSRLTWLLGLDAVCVLIVAAAAWWRLLLVPRCTGRSVAMTATMAMPLATAMFALAGPLQPGWAQLAGTPVAQLGSARPAATAASSAGTSPGSSAGTSSGFAGRARRAADQNDGHEVITVTAHTTGQPAQDLRIVLRGTPDGDAIVMSSGTVRLDPASGGPAYAGPVTRLNGQRLTAALRGPGGQAEQALVTLVISGNRATGRVLVQAGPA